ncbi:anaerobic ribonucleoside-triphosphate reductase activating protein [Sulfurirhabdus autotrophica]|uniref:Anaerobic ribonucleoside-triphosphate reductase activating protein n=1 Tax=Sulfurirhabdus autotrophica TaxID=1706046 RepID=A0A4R3XY99_9PROT|nr:anaerobic ribonucleoside-triphosphate reductase activating protein [Sulfurirhabdus autotrophica]TCV83278.1 anaerobic ribonucleoside-triphosphate reductase activating protein [Sulfurirhabdus autotrophica]
MDDLRIGGFTPLTTTDYPGHLAAVVFCQGCPWRCSYCQNPHLIPANEPTQISWQDIIEFMKKRNGLLDAVVFSGGEPTLQGALETAIHEIHHLGFKVGLHTAGMYPERLAKILPLVDWVGMDIKAPFEQYEKITGVSNSGEKARISTKLLIKSGVAHEFRTTWHPQLLNESDLLTLATELVEMGATNFVLQEFRASGCADQNLLETIISAAMKNLVIARISPSFDQFFMRTA